MVFDALGVDVIDEDGGILVVVRSFDEERDSDLYPDVQVPQPTDDRVRIDIQIAGLLVTPLAKINDGAKEKGGEGPSGGEAVDQSQEGGSGEECTIVAILNADIKMAMVPISLINFLTRKIVWHGLKAFRTKAVSCVSRSWHTSISFIFFPFKL